MYLFFFLVKFCLCIKRTHWNISFLPCCWSPSFCLFLSSSCAFKIYIFGTSCHDPKRGNDFSTFDPSHEGELQLQLHCLHLMIQPFQSDPWCRVPSSQGLESLALCNHGIDPTISQAQGGGAEQLNLWGEIVPFLKYSSASGCLMIHSCHLQVPN